MRRTIAIRFSCIAPLSRYTPPKRPYRTVFALYQEGTSQVKLSSEIGQRQRGGGKTYRVIWGGGGGKRTAERALQNHLWRPQKLGLVWSVPLSFKGNDRESPKKGGGKTYRRGGGPKTFLGRGFSQNLRYVFHPPEFSTPLGRSLKRRYTLHRSYDHTNRGLVRHSVHK